jgi:hypothetical protein
MPSRLRPLLLFVPLLLSAQNALTPEESRAGWRLLFDGRTFRNWQDPTQKTPPGDSWAIEDGSLRTLPNPRIAEDLFTAESYSDFELQFEWKVSPGGNSGVKYRIQKQVFIDMSRLQRGPGGWEGIAAREIANPRSVRAELAPETKAGEFAVGFEFQLIDDDRHPDAKAGPTRQTGALYAMLPHTDRAARPAGDWNHARIIAIGGHIEHWINGVKVLDGSLTDPALKQNTLARWGNFPAVADLFLKPSPTGPLCLQHHGDLVWFRALKIRPR